MKPTVNMLKLGRAGSLDVPGISERVPALKR